MNFNKKLTPILLIAAILAVVAVGSFLLLRITTNEPDTTSADVSPQASPPPASPQTDTQPLAAEPVEDTAPYHYTGEIILEMDVADGGYTYISIAGDQLTTDKSQYFLEEDGYRVESSVILYDMPTGESREIPNTHEEWFESGSGVSITNWARDDSGQLYLLYSEGKNRYLRILDAQGTVLSDGIPFDIREQDISKIRIYDNKIYTDHESFHVNTLDGKKTTAGVVPLDYCVDFDIDPYGGLYLVTQERNNTGLAKYDLNTDELIYRAILPYRNPIKMFYDESTESVNVVYSTKIVRVNAADGSGRRVEVDFETELPYIIGFPDDGGHKLFSVVSDAEGDIYLSMLGPEKSLIYKLVKTAGERLKREITTELVITAVYKQPYIEEAAARYAKIRPDVEIKWDVLFPTMEEGRAALNGSDADMKLLTKIMANDVGDIVSIGGMGQDIATLFRTDAFIDLSAYIKADKSYPELNHAALDGITIDGQIKGLPLGLAPSYFYLNRAVLKDNSKFLDISKPLTWREAMQAAIDHPVGEGEVFFGVHSSVLLMYAIFANNPELIDVDHKTVNLKQDWFIELLETYKAMCLTPGATVPVDAVDEFVTEANVVFRFYQDDWNMMTAYQRAYESNYEVVPMFNGEINRNAVIQPIVMYSVSANSQQATEAWNFLSFMMEANQQALVGLMGTPLNEKGMDQYFNIRANVPQEVREKAYDFMRSIDYTYLYYLYNGYIREPIDRYVAGEITLDEALDQAEQNVLFRLNE